MEEKKIALLGQPNSGKSTLFNALTGMHQHVGNWPGKTVEKKEGVFKCGDISCTLADLPGSYCLSANSDEEIVTRDYIADGGADLVLILADASQLERSLFMLADYAGIRTPAMLVVTMTDVAEQQGKKINLKALENKLNIPVAGVIAPDKKSYGEFFKTLEQALKEPRSLDASSLNELALNGEKGSEYTRALSLVPAEGIGAFSREWLAMKLMEQDFVAAARVSSAGDREAVKSFEDNSPDGALYTSDCKFKWIEKLLDGAVTRPKEPSKLLTKFDRAAVSKRWGKPIAIGIVLAAIVVTMCVAAPIMGVAGFIPSLIGVPLASGLAAIGVSEGIITFINSTFVNVLYWTVSMVGFVFAINLVFGLLEEVGYMARVSYAFDGTLSKIGLQGKAIMPMFVSLGCTIGGAASARVVDSWGQRLLTIAVAWAVPCAATFAVIPTLATYFFGVGGAMLVMVLLFAIMFIHIPITAKVFGRKLNPPAERTGLIMELPPYHKPRWGFLFRTALDRVWTIFKKAFVVEIVVSVIFYFLAYSGTGDVSDSLLCRFGETIEPVTRFFGLGWQTFTAFISSMLSKEAVLGVLSSIFAGSGSLMDSTTGAAAAVSNLGELIIPVISKAEALAFIVAVTFNVPCLQAVVSTYQETHSMKWTFKIAIYYIITALILACIVYHIAALFV